MSLSFASQISDVEKIASSLFPDIQFKISEAKQEELGFKDYPAGNNGLKLISNGKTILFFFPRKGSYYHGYLPESPYPKNEKEIRKEIRGLEEALKEDKFPSPKHRYGTEAELSWLRAQLKPKHFFAEFLGVKGDFLLFIGPGGDEFISWIKKSLYYEKIDKKGIGIDEFTELQEGSGIISFIADDAIELSFLHYAFKRPYPKSVLGKFPQVRTIIFRSIDEHSLGPMGVQIENRKQD